MDEGSNMVTYEHQFKDVRLVLRLSEDLKLKIEKTAQHLNCSTSVVARLAIERGLEVLEMENAA